MSTVPEVELIHIPDEVREFADKQRITHLLPKVLEITQRLFPDFRLSISLYIDYELEDMNKILLTIHQVPFNVEQYLQARDAWTFALIDTISGPNMRYFSLDLDLVS